MVEESTLNGLNVAILVEDGFEQVELTQPRRALEEAGATTELVSPLEDTVRGWQRTEWGDEFRVDRPLRAASPAGYDALLLPGGVISPDRLRRNQQALDFVRGFFAAHKPVAAICHGPWTLIDAELVEGRRMTSYHSIQTDLKNAGADWVDQEVVVDGPLITSRSPRDLDAFTRVLVEEFPKKPLEVEMGA